jgi:NADH:ubiquinone oxidoreductase subunit 4 (subunit M)
MAGVPPLIGFFSKQYVLYSAIQNGYNFIAFVAIFVSVISASYYLKIIKTFFIDFDSTSAVSIEEQGINADYSATAPFNSHTEIKTHDRLSNFHSFLISTLTLLILFFIFKPSLILNTTQLLSLSLFYL